MALAYVVGDFDDGAAFIDQALVLNSNFSSAWLYRGYVKVWLGQPEVAIENIERAMRLGPHDPQLVNALRATAGAHFVAGRYDEALSWAEKAIRVKGDYILAHGTVAACAALAGRISEAEKVVKRLRQLQPQLRIADLMELFPLRRPEDRARWISWPAQGAGA